MTLADEGTAAVIRDDRERAKTYARNVELYVDGVLARAAARGDFEGKPLGTHKALAAALQKMQGRGYLQNLRHAELATFATLLWNELRLDEITTKGKKG